MKIFKACDIRGVVGRDWEAPESRKIGRALGRLMQARGEDTICVGGDFRRSTLRLKEALIAGLVEAGVQVLDVGQAPTPVVYFAARHTGHANAAIVTASHNPGRYNGIKFLIGGQPPTPRVVWELQHGLDTPLAPSSLGSVTTCQVLDAYERWAVTAARQLADQRAASDAGCDAPAPLRIVVDAMAAACTHLAPRVLAAAGYDVTSLVEEVDPDLATRDPNPSHDAHLATLIETVTSRSADLGVALDGDGDRVVFVDTRGVIARPEQIAVVLIRECFERPTVVYDLKCASLLAQAVAAVGGRAIMRPSGHGFIKATMIAERAELGVEVSGHHFFGLLDGGDDGLLTALVLARLVARTGRPLAERLAAIGWPAITPDLRLGFDGDAAEAVETIAETCGGRVTRLDGVRAEYDHGWALARASITEPALTLRFEGRDEAELRRIAARFLAAVPETARRVLEMIE